MPKIGKRIRDAVSARFAAAWASAFAAASAGYNLPARDSSRLAQIDWTRSRLQVFHGDVDIESIDESTTVYEPVVTIHTAASQHTGEEQFRRFSGDVELVVRFYLEWDKGAALPDFDDAPDLIEDVVVQILHDPQWVGALPAGVSYSGELAVARGQVVMGGENWRRVVEARLRFGVDV